MTLARIPALGLGVLTLALATSARADVTAVQLGAKVVVAGDSTDDVIHVEGTGALGELRVLEGTSPTEVASFFGVRDVEIKTGDGNDAVNVSGIEIGGSIKAKLGAGVDFMRIDDLLADGVTVRATFIGNSLAAALGDQAGDSFECRVQNPTGSVRFGGSVSVRGSSIVTFDGISSSGDSDPSDIHIGANFVIRSKLTTVVVLDDINIGGSTSIRFGGGADFVEIDDAHFTRNFELRMGAGNDAVEFADAVELNANALFDGGTGTDSITGSPPTVGGVTVAKNIEG